MNKRPTVKELQQVASGISISLAEQLATKKLTDYKEPVINYDDGTIHVYTVDNQPINHIDVSCKIKRSSHWTIVKSWVTNIFRRLKWTKHI